MAGAERIADAFASSRGRAALMPYMMGGYPTLDASRAVASAYVAGGADLVELGIPFSDPVADGPVIHAAGVEALRGGTGVADVLGLAEQLAQDVAVVVMCYVNLVMRPGVDVFAASLARAGVSGLIVPDLPMEESGPVHDACEAAGIALVPLVAPTTPDARLAEIGSRAGGFVYAVSVTGTTGERSGVDFTPTVTRTKAATDVPVAVGFGIATPDHATAAADAGADGVIIGTRLVRAAGDGEDVEALLRGFAHGLAG